MPRYYLAQREQEQNQQEVYQGQVAQVLLAAVRC